VHLVENVTYVVRSHLVCLVGVEYSYVLENLFAGKLVVTRSAHVCTLREV